MSELIPGLDLLVPAQPGDRLMIRIITSLISDGAEVSVLEAGGVGPDTAVVVIEIDGRQMRLTATP
ncbi:hypothetical protein ACIQFP_26610, partial [Nocardiopsis alba]|uniref:hypothetical protein n=1 Tax=Nocardiopsis alba TaxID=53437 RepID=UPI00381127B0